MAPVYLFPLGGRRVFVAGHRGMVGSALVRRLATRGLRDSDGRRERASICATRARCRRLVRRAPAGRRLRGRRDGRRHLSPTTPVPAEFLYDNLAIATNVIEAARRSRRRRSCCFFGSSCIYPRLAPQPIAEDALLTGPLEPTNEWYAIAKIAGLKLCEAYRRQYGCDFISAMPTNLYGPGDNFDLLAEPRAAGADRARSTRPLGAAGERSRSGAPASRAASSCMSTTSPTPRSS